MGVSHNESSNGGPFCHGDGWNFDSESSDALERYENKAEFNERASSLHAVNVFCQLASLGQDVGKYTGYLSECNRLDLACNAISRTLSGCSSR